MALNTDYAIRTGAFDPVQKVVDQEISSKQLPQVKTLALCLVQVDLILDLRFFLNLLTDDELKNRALQRYQDAKVCAIRFIIFYRKYTKYNER